MTGLLLPMPSDRNRVLADDLPLVDELAWATSSNVTSTAAPTGTLWGGVPGRLTGTRGSVLQPISVKKIVTSMTPDA